MENRWQIGPVKLANGFDAVIHRFCEKRQRYIGELQDGGSGSWFAKEWDASGWYCFGYKTEENLCNLAPPPKKTVWVKVWVNVDADGRFQVRQSRETADGWAHANRIACKEIDIEVTEGEGL